jgi:hypothetical protein
MLLEETNASGVAQADYIYLNGRPIVPLNPSSGALYFLHDDVLSTPQLATDTDLELGRLADGSRTMHLNDVQEVALMALIRRSQKQGANAW